MVGRSLKPIVLAPLQKVAVSNLKFRWGWFSSESSLAGILEDLIKKNSENIEIGDVNGNSSKKNERNQIRTWVTTGKKGPKKRNFPGYRQKCPLKNWNSTEGLESYERNEQQVMVNGSLGSNGSAVKLGQGESGQVSSEDFLKPSNWQINGQANGNLEKQMERNLSLRNWRGNVVVLLRYFWLPSQSILLYEWST